MIVPLCKDAILALTWPISDPVPVVPPPPKAERAATLPPELDTLRQALAAIPNDTEPLDYDSWRNIIFAIHHATEGSADGLALAHEFSARSGKYDPEFIDNRFWPYAGQTSGEVITERTLFALAARHGWTDPAIADDFEAVVDPPRKRDKTRFAPVPAHEFAVPVKVGWVIKGIIPRAELVVLYGESTAGKSFMALDMAAAVARGVEWCGNRSRQSPVVYVVAEGATGFRNRLRAYAHQNQINLADLPFYIIHQPPNMLDPKDALDLAAAILTIGKPELIVIDTLAQVMPGGNENSGEDMGRVLAHCRGLHAAVGATVMLVHHSGKDATKGARGWSGLKGAADAELEVLRFEDSRVMTVTKQKDGQDGDEYGFALDTVLVDMDDEGDEVTSCVVRHGVSTGRKNAPRGRCETMVYRMASDLIGLSGEPVAESAVIAAYKAEVALEEGKRDARGQHAKRALVSLCKKQLLVRQHNGGVGLPV